MRKQTKSLKVGVIVALVVLLLLLPSVMLAQDGGEVTEDDTGSYCDSSMAQYLMEELELEGFDCEEMAGQGIGLGEIKKAWHLSFVLPGYDGNWEGLLAAKLEGQGWGNLKQAARISNGDPDLMEHYLTLRQDDVGWGEIKHAQALADAGIYSFDEALALLQSGVDWDEIKTELGAEGPPPWAGGKNKADKGQPPWAGGWKNVPSASSAESQSAKL